MYMYFTFSVISPSILGLWGYFLYENVSTFNEQSKSVPTKIRPLSYQEQQAKVCRHIWQAEVVVHMWCEKMR